MATQSWVSQVAGLSCEFAGQFWRLVREWKVQSWGLLRDFRGSTRDSLAGRPSSRKKHLENFSKFCLWMFWRLVLAACWQLTSVAKNACLAKIGAVFKSFSVFPRTFMTVHLLSKLSPSQTLRAPISNLHCCIFSAQILQVTGMGFLIWTHLYLILCFSPCFFAFVYVLEMGLCFGYYSMFMLRLRMLLLEFDLIISCFLFGLHPVLS